MSALFHQSKNEKKSYEGNLNSSEVRHAITLHPVKDTKRMYKLYVYLLGFAAQELLKISTKIQDEIQKTTKLLFRSSTPNIDQSNESLSSTTEKLSSLKFMAKHFRF